MPQQAEAYLRGLKVPDTVKADAWDAIYAAKDDADAEARLKRLPVTNEVRAQLWDLRAEPAPVAAPASQGQPATFGNVLDASPAQVPIGIVKGAAGSLYNVVRGISKLPLIPDLPPKPAIFDATTPGQRVGQVAEQTAEFMGPAGLISRGASLLKAANYAPKTLTAARAGMEAMGAGTVAAVQGGNPATAAVMGAAGPLVGAALPKPAALKESAEKLVVQALGPTKERFKAMARRIAPEIMKRGLGGSRESLLETAATKADEAGDLIDGALQQFGAKQVGVAPVVSALEAAKDAFRTTQQITVQQAAARGLTQKARSLGNGMVEIDVVFEPRAVKQLDGLQRIVSDLGDTATVDQLVNVRRAWDKVVDQAGGFAHRAGGAVGVPLKDQSEAWAKREATTAIRKLLATEVPELAVLNKEFAFWKSLDDVLTQTVQRTQAQGPGLRGAVVEVAGAAAASTNGLGQAFVLGKLAKGANAVFTSPRWRLIDANLKNKLADSIVTGNLQGSAAALARINAAIASRVPLPAQ